MTAVAEPNSTDAAGPPSAPFVPIVPAGGSGTRLWPLSRSSRPKFLLDLTGSGSSLLQETIDRLLPGADRAPIVVTGAAHAQAVRDQVPDQVRVLIEPTGRSTMPAIALGAALAEQEDPDCVVGSFAADHVVADPAALAVAVRQARRAAELGYLVTLGITPTAPATSFGYIEQSDATPAELEGTGALGVARFVEKPELATAEEFLATGRFRWNAGMFLARASTLLDALAEQIPSLAAGARRIAAAHGTPEQDRVLEEVWPTLTAIAVDHALAEPLAAAGRVAMVPVDCGWDDVGDFAVLARLLRERAEGDDDVVVLGDAETASVRSRATVYGATGRLVALVGLDGVSVVDTEDVLLVLSDDHAQDLSTLVAGLAENDHPELHPPAPHHDPRKDRP